MSITVPVIAQKGPYPLELEAGKQYFWCTCGLSQNQPCCDGAHKGSGMKSMPFTAEQSGTAYLCGCKQTATPPYCDGRHAEL